MKNVEELMKQAVTAGVFTGGALLAASGGSVAFNKSFGTTDNTAGIPVNKETVFDLASLTKPLATAPAVMMLIHEKKLSFETKVADLFPMFSDGGKGDISVLNLLCHNSGLPAHRPYYEELRTIPWGKRDALLRKMAFSEKLINAPGEKVVYSDIGFMILSWVVEKLSGLRFDKYVKQYIYQPLTITDLFFNRIPFHKKEIREYAATENCPWRKGVLSGEVHDDNAWAAGGICGHAGLFGTISAVYHLLNEYMAVVSDGSAERYFDPVILKQFLTQYGNTGRTPGFDMPSKNGSSSGVFFSENTVGHLGFTGTSFWMDLQEQIIIILLTNRVHPTRGNTLIQKFRPEIHNCVMQILLNNKSAHGA